MCATLPPLLPRIRCTYCEEYARGAAVDPAGGLVSWENAHVRGDPATNVTTRCTHIFNALKRARSLSIPLPHSPKTCTLAHSHALSPSQLTGAVHNREPHTRRTHSLTDASHALHRRDNYTVVHNHSPTPVHSIASLTSPPFIHSQKKNTLSTLSPLLRSELTLFSLTVFHRFRRGCGKTFPFTHHSSLPAPFETQ